MKKLLIALMMSMMLFGLLIPTIQGSPQDGGFSDNFNDNSLDTTKWETFQWVMGEGWYPGQPLPEVYERNQRLEIYYNYPSPWTAFGGILTKQTYDMKDSFISVQAVLNQGWRAFIIISPEKKSGIWVDPTWGYMYEFIRENFEYYPNDYGCVRVFRFSNGQKHSLYQGWGDYKRIGNMKIQITNDNIIRFYLNGGVLCQETYALNTYDLYTYLGAQFYIDSDNGKPIYYYGTVAFDNFKLTSLYMFPQDEQLTYHGQYWGIGTWIPNPPPNPETDAYFLLGQFIADSRDGTPYDWRNAHIIQGIKRGGEDTGKRFKVGATEDRSVVVNYWDFIKPIQAGKYYVNVKALRESREATTLWVDLRAYGGGVPFYGFGVVFNFQFKYKEIYSGIVHWSPYFSSDTTLFRAYAFDIFFDAKEYRFLTWVDKWGDYYWFHVASKYDKDAHGGYIATSMPNDWQWYEFTVDLAPILTLAWDMLQAYLALGEPTCELLLLRCWSVEVYVETIGCNVRGKYDYVNFIVVD